MSRGKRFDGEPKLNKKKVVATVIAVIVVIMVIISLKRLFTNDKVQEMTVQTGYFTAYDNEKYGVINNKGETVISFDYDEMIIVPNSEEDVFICTYNVDYENETYSTKVLNASGDEILTNYSNVQAIEKSDVNGVYYDSNLLIYESDGLYGLIDYEGNKVTESIYTSIYALDGTDKSIVVEQDGLKGIVNSSLKSLTVECIYNNIECLNENSEDDGYITLSNGQYGIASASGKTVLENKFSEIKHVSGNSMYVVNDGNGEKVIDENENVILESSYDDIISINGENMVIVEDDLYGIVTTIGGTLVEPEYEYLSYAESGYYVAEKDGLYGVISVTNEVCVEFKYTSLEYISSTGFYQGENSDYTSDIINRDFEIELAGVIVSDINVESGYIKVRENSEYKYYNLNFEEVANTDVLKSNTLFLVKNDGKYGYVNKDGDMIVDCIYDDATEQNAYGYCAVKSNGVWGVLASDGTVVLEPSVNLDNNLYIQFIGQWHLYEDASLNIYVK